MVVYNNLFAVAYQLLCATPKTEPIVLVNHPGDRVSIQHHPLNPSYPMMIQTEMISLNVDLQAWRQRKKERNDEKLDSMQTMSQQMVYTKFYGTAIMLGFGIPTQEHDRY